MQSNNPVFRNSDEFNGRASANAYGNQTYPGNGAPYQGYGAQAPGAYAQTGYSDPASWSVGAPPVAGAGARMTIDSVVQRTGLSLAILMVAAVATWVLTGDITGSTIPSNLYLAVGVGSLGAFALSMVNSFKRVISPGLVVAFAVLEGVALGALSKMFDAIFGSGVVSGAVIGTFAAFAGTLAAYKFFDIKVGQKFRTFVIAAMFGMVGLSLMELVLGMFGNSIGLFGFGGLGLLTAIAGLALGVFMLILDFDFVEQGIAAGLDERESWRAAFALMVSLVWIYTNLLRLLAILQDN